MTVPGSSGASVPETEALLQRVAGMIAGARALPLSSSAKLDNKDEILELLREASERLPEELRQARWMLKEREEYLAATQRQADELVESARSEAQRLVQRTQILKEAQAQARRTTEQAREDARRLKLEAEDYADQRLAQFEIILERTLKTVASGRQKLAGVPEKEDERMAAPVAAEGDPRRAAGRPPSVPAEPAAGIAPVSPMVPPPPMGRSSSGSVTIFGMGTAPGNGGGDGDGSWADESIFDQDSLD